MYKWNRESVENTNGDSRPGIEYWYLTGMMINQHISTYVEKVRSSPLAQRYPTGKRQEGNIAPNICAAGPYNSQSQEPNESMTDGEKGEGTTQ